MTAPYPSEQPVVRDGIVLLHGIFRTARSMESFRRFLESYGYKTLNVDYPSTQLPIERIVETILPSIQEFCSQVSGRIHFVGYSMGALLIRTLLASSPPVNLGRVVMMGPPNQGSEVADFIRNWRLYRKLYGPAGQQLTTAANPPLNDPVTYELGILAGNRSIDPISSYLIRKPNDGKVSVDSTHLNGMKAHRVIRATHTFFPLNREAWQLTLRFIEHGTFDVAA